MRDWHAVWHATEASGPDWNEPDTYVETIALLDRRGDDWLDCLLQLADRSPTVSELAGERFTVESGRVEGSHRWWYSVRGVHSGRTWGTIVVDPREAVDDLVVLAVMRIGFNGRAHTSEEEFEALSGLLDPSASRLFDERSSLDDPVG